MAHVKTLTKHGDCLALVIDRPLLDLLGVDEKTPLEIRTDGSTLIITPLVDEGRKEMFKEKLDKIRSRHGASLRKLAE